MAVVISVEHLSKSYRLGQIGTGTLTYDLQLWWAKILGKPSPLSRIGETDHGNRDGELLWALKDVSFTVEQGEVLGVIGRNGAGKSTLLKILSRVTAPTSGRIRAKGRVASLLEVGTGFHPELTGRENLYLNGAILGMNRREIDRKFDEIVDFAEVEKFIDTPVKRYSSGMYVRLAFAVAAHLEPEILLVDEVLAVGDTEFQKKCLGKMSDVAKEGRTVLFVSHSMPSILSLCKRVILLKAGNVENDDIPNRVISHYLSDSVNTTSAEVDLCQHPGRSHSKEVALEKAWILNGQGLKTNSIIMGEDINVFFQFRCSRPITNPGFGFGIEDEFGRRIFSLNNYITSKESAMVKSISAGVVNLNIPKLMLLPGNYFISVSLVENQNAWIDFVEQALAFVVHPADVYGSGKIPERTHGVVFVQGKVSIIAERM